MIEKVRSGMFASIPVRYRSSDISQCLDCVPNGISYDKSYFITGPCGSGKTHLAVAIMKELIINSKMDASSLLECHFSSFPETIALVKDSFGGKDSAVDALRSACKCKGVAIIDDICFLKAGETEVNSLLIMVNYRYANCLPSIYTANLSLKEISKLYGDRLASRLASCEQIDLTGKKDRRLS